MKIWKKFLKNESLKSAGLKELIREHFDDDKLNMDPESFLEFKKMMYSYLSDLSDILPLIINHKEHDPVFLNKFEEDSTHPIRLKKDGTPDKRCRRSSEKIVELLKDYAKKIKNNRNTNAKEDD